MTTETQTGNPFANIFQFYSDQAEKIAPVIKQGLDDWFTIYNKMWTDGMRLQSEWMQQLTGNQGNTGFNTQARELGEKIIELQKELSTCMVNVGIKGVKSIIDTAKKK